MTALSPHDALMEAAEAVRHYPRRYPPDTPHEWVEGWEAMRRDAADLLARLAREATAKPSQPTTTDGR